MEASLKELAELLKNEHTLSSYEVHTSHLVKVLLKFFKVINLFRVFQRNFRR